MKYSSVLYSDIDLSNRIDAEYFQAQFLQIEEELIKKNGQQLKNFCSITGSAFYPPAAHLYEVGELPFIRCVDCISYPMITTRQHNSFEKIPISFANNHSNIKRLDRGEIVITKVGSPCYASIIHDISDVALSRTVLGLKKINNINPYYLTAFLRSKYGFNQLIRERELTIQFQLTLDRVGNILIFIPSNTMLEKSVENCLLLYEQINNQSNALFNKSVDIMLTELGMTNWHPYHQLTFVKNWSEVKKTSRLDADYFQPRYEDIIKAINNYSGGSSLLENLVNIKKCTEVGSEEYLDEGVPFTRVSNLTFFDITEEKYISEELYQELKQHQPKKGEILLSKDATPGIAHYLGDTPKKMIPSGGILRLKRKTNKVNDEYLTLALNSLLVKQQINRDAGGSVILHWRPDQVKKTLIPILPQSMQVQIKNTFNEALALHKQAKQLLKCAKNTVEIAIEQDEQTALDWLNSQIQAIGANDA